MKRLLVALGLVTSLGCVGDVTGHVSGDPTELSDGDDDIGEPGGDDAHDDDNDTDNDQGADDDQGTDDEPVPTDPGDIIVGPPGVPAVIIDTDMGPDVDDAGALAVMHALQDNGEATLLAVMISTSSGTGHHGIGFIDAVNTYYGRPSIPIGLWKGGAFLSGGEGFPADISANPAQFPHDLGDDNASVPDAIALYRSVLAAQADGSVTIACIGMMNNLLALIQSAPDAASALSGAELVTQKVALLVQMGGNYPSGSEFNFYQQVHSGMTKAAVEGWPTPIVFIGYDLGVTILTGGPLTTSVPDTNPVRRAYELYVGPGNIRSSWDIAAVLFAVRGASTYWHMETVGSNQIEPNGNNAWLASPDLQQGYLTPQASDSEIAAVLNALMIQPPAGQ